MEAFNPDSHYKKMFTKHIVKPLVGEGFKRYKSSNIARITEDSIFQLFNFQKEAYGGKAYTVNVAIRPLYIPHENISLQPGERIGYFSHGYDHWWSYKDEITSESSFLEVSSIITNTILPMLNDLGTSTSLLNEFFNKKYALKWPTSECWRLNDLAFMCLKLGDFRKSNELFIKARNSFKNIGFEWALSAAETCDKVISMIGSEGDKVSNYLEFCESETRKNLGLTEW